MRVTEPVRSPSSRQQRVATFESGNPVIDRLWSHRPAELASEQVDEDNIIVVKIDPLLGEEKKVFPVQVVEVVAEVDASVLLVFHAQPTLGVFARLNFKQGGRTRSGMPIAMP